jgi:catechol 2,3-dioxygenase-like lactoylglutathione lyase family enzyme
VKVQALDHLVLTVKDMDRTCQFYEKILGMVRREYLPGRFALHFGRQKLNLHPADKIPDQNVRHATPGSADLCFLTDTPVEEWLEMLVENGIRALGPPSKRIGAEGPLHSIYFYDPDENLIEVSRQIKD